MGTIEKRKENYEIAPMVIVKMVEQL